MIKIYTRETKVLPNNTKEYKIRVLGADFWISEDEFKKDVKLGQMFYKANKPVY